ncbi:MAG TPA: electron transport complex subunit RsxG [Gammaproteobacteria bacterium]
MFGHAVLEPSYRKRTAYQAMLLGGMATLASAVLVLGDMETRGTIALRKAEDLKASLSQVLPDAMHDNDLLSDVLTLTPQQTGSRPVTVYRARLEDRISAVAYTVSSTGYAGPITCIIGIAANGEILGVRVLSHAETPGLGDKIEIARDNWITSFNGRSLANTDEKQWQVKKDGGIFDQFTGATITPRAVVKAVHEGVALFEANRAALLALKIPTAEAEGEIDHE